MKKYIYIVEGQEFEDTECFGKAWKAAKQLAADCHAPIFRTKIEEDVYCNGGVFLSRDCAKPEDIAIL